MWINGLCHAVPQHLTDCPIGRQRSPCNFITMQFLAKCSHGRKRQIPHDLEDIYDQAYRSVQIDRAELTHITHRSSLRDHVDDRQGARGDWQLKKVRSSIMWVKIRGELRVGLQNGRHLPPLFVDRFKYLLTCECSEFIRTAEIFYFTGVNHAARG
jgi:hypothetical protein